MSGSVDWSATGSMFSGIGTLLGAIAIILAALIGRKAVEDFRRQKLVEREIDYSEKLLTLAYRLKDATATIRSPMTLGGELNDSEKALDEAGSLANLSDAEKSRLIQGNVFFLRTKFHESLYLEAYEIMPFVIAYFGQAIADKFKEIINVRHSIRVYANAYARDEHRDPALTQKIESIVWEGADPQGPDKIVTMIDANIAAIEAIVLPKLRIGHTN